MYSDPNLDTPPPQSQFRRPWSPEAFDPHSYNRFPDSHSNFVNHHQAEYQPEYQPDYGYGYGYPEYPQQQRREASDVSVEALDLADYAMTLRNQGQYDMYPPPSPRMHRPLRPPSMDTLSSTVRGSPRRSGRRPFSLPPPSAHSHSSRRSHPTPPRSANSHAQSHMSHNRAVPPSEPEIDISHFPAWSRNWYKPKASPASPPDIYTPLPPSSWNPRHSPFDPGNAFGSGSFNRGDAYDPYAPSTSLGYDSSRDMLPWSSQPPEYGPTIDDSLKEERLRMLDREFGPNAKGKAPESGDFLDEDGKPLIGTVDSKGRLVTKGPKKRMALRMFQIVLALTAAIPAIYAALIIKPKDKPPPSGSIQSYVLYVFSVLTSLLLLYMFAFRPCCCPGKRRKPGPAGNPLANGMMVLPIPGGKKGKQGKQKGKKAQQGQGDVQVNLIVDPNAFTREDEDDDSEEEYDEDGSIPGSYRPGAARRKRRRAKRRSVFAGFAMEEDWKRARSWAKKVTAVDVVGIVLWGAVFIYIIIGKHCPIGQFDGWCNAYNVSTAAACLLCVSFCIGTFFDVQDLSSSKVSPRAR